jgi:glycosyltransferase involved in cell wall biosynthesis
LSASTRRASSVSSLLVDARPVDHPTARQRGIGRYVTGLLRGLHEIEAPVVALYGSDSEAAVLSEAIPGLHLVRWSPQAVREHVSPRSWYLATQLMLHPIPLDPIPSVITQARLPVAAVMYDVIPYRFPEHYQVESNARVQAPLRAALARTVDAMLAISEFSAVTAAEALGYPIERIRSIGAGVEEQFVPPSIRSLPRPDRVLPPVVGRYVVSVTGGDERKNTEGLLRAWALLDPATRHDRHLVIATAHSPAVLRRWERWADEVGIRDDVIFTGSITDDEMVAILQGAELAVMPSTEEGFGLPVVEAAACGTPVICSDVSSLPEVLSERAAEFDPFDPASIARALHKALTDDGHREVLLAAARRAAGRWTWSRVAADTIDALADLGPRWPQRLQEPERRIAIAGPFAGSVSGIGRYDEAVVEALRRRRAIDVRAPLVEVFVDASASPERSQTAGGRRPVRAIGRYAKPWDFDHVVAVLGSSPHHVATAELAVAEPCHVWLHEASLVGVHVGLAHQSGSERWAKQHVASCLERNESPAVRATIGDDELLDARFLDEIGVRLLGETLDRARSVIVSSHQAAEIVRTLRPHGVAMLVLPLAYPPTVAPVGIPPARDIVAVGWLAANKSPELAIEVLRMLEPDVTLTFVGSSAGDTADHVRGLAEACGVGDRVAFTGRLDDDAYAARIARSRVGLQLRTAERGEMSAAITDLLAHGIPAVTTLATAGPSSPGLRVLRPDSDQLASAISSLFDDDTWSAASADALDRAARWTFDDVAQVVTAWLDVSEELPPGTVRNAVANGDEPHPLASTPLHD